MIVRLAPKDVQYDAIKWENNEPEIREFVGEDANLKFKNEGLEVWNKETETWENCPMFAYIVKGVKGELFVVTPDTLSNGYNIVE